MNHEALNLKPGAQKVADIVAAGGTVSRSKAKPEGSGYSVEGIKLVLPAMVNPLVEAGVIVKLDEDDTTETWGAPRAEVEVIGEVKASKPRKAKVAKEPTPTDILMWVGFNHYPTIVNFAFEAQRLGVSKRVSRVGAGIVPGTTRIFVAHDEGQRGDAVIFGYATVSDIEVIRLHDDDELPASVRNRKVTIVGPDELSLERERGCGYREEHNAIYLVSQDFEWVRPGIDYNKEIDEQAKRFRSFMRVDGDKLLKGATKEDPQERALEQISLPEIEGLDVRGRRWTPELREALAKVVERYPVASQGLRDFALATGRSLHGVLYQWQRRAKWAEQAERAAKKEEDATEAE